MVPVFVVGVMGASLANCVLAVAAYLKDKLAYEAGGGRGVSGDKESIPASACCMPQSLSLISLSPSCLHGYAHGYLFKSQCPCDNANASQSLFPSFFLKNQCWRQSGSPLPPKRPGATVLTWRTARAADVMHGLVVFLVLVPASLVFYAIGGHLPGEAETEKNEAGSALEGRRAKRATWPIPPGPSLTSWGREATRSPLSPSRSGPQTRPQGEEVPGRRMAAFRVG